MNLIPIGEAAARLGLRTSALRYYDERGLVPVQNRQAGQRLYGRDELRRLAFIKIAHRLGISLETAAAIMDAPGQEWRETVRDQIAALDDLIKQAQGAQTFLSHALNCPHAHPTRDCPAMTGALDQLVDGAASIEQLRERYG
jgi:DNA-binding transcriptional MerR regulator